MDQTSSQDAARKSRVFLPAVPSRFDAGMRTWIPIISLISLEKWGDVITMLPPDAARAGPGPCAIAIREKMRDFNDKDWIVCVGDPTLIGIAAANAARQAGGLLRMLKWDRMSSCYFAVEVRT